MMNQTGGSMTGWMGGGWTDGSMWVWTVAGTLVVILLVIVITKLLKK
jgi:hypothetical protein